MSSYTSARQYPLAVRDSSLTTAVGLLMRTAPYAVARFVVLMGASIACIVWIVVTIGGASWLSNHIAKAFGVVWLIGGVSIAGWFWATMFRYLLHVIDCGHVAVLTELIVHDRISNGGESCSPKRSAERAAPRPPGTAARPTTRAAAPQRSPPPRVRDPRS